jgi:beta-galactosidase
MKPVEVIKQWHAALWKLGVTCDLAHPEGDLSGYKLVVVPSLHLVTDEGAGNLERFVAGGGTAVVGSEVAHATTAEVVDSYVTGEPAWTRNTWERGVSHYLTTLPTDLARVFAAVCAESGVATSQHPGLELVRRSHPDGRGFLFAINHTEQDEVVETTGALPDGTPVDGTLVVPAGAVRIVTTPALR